MLQRHFTAALQRVPPSVSARDQRLYDAMRSQVTLHQTLIRLVVRLVLLTLTPGSAQHSQLRRRLMQLS